MTVLLLGIAGGIGALLRFVFDGLIRTRLGRSFPWGTIIINFTGSLLLGYIVGMVLHHHAPDDLRIILGIGFCGGYTTFSTASFETVRLIEDKRYLVAFSHAGGTLVLAFIGAAIGLMLTIN